MGGLQAAVLLHPVGQRAVVIIAPQCRVAACGQYLEHAFFHAQHGNIEGAAAQVEYGVQAFASLVQPVSQGGCRGLVDEPQHGQARQLRGIFGGLALGIVEVGRHGNHRAFYRSAQTGFSALAQGGKQAGADFNRRFVARPRAHAHHALTGMVGHQCIRQPLPLYRFNIVQAAPHQTLDGYDGVSRVHGLALQGLVPRQDRALRAAIGQCASFCIVHRRRQNDAPLRIGQALRQAVAHGGHQRMRGTQVDADANTALVRIRADARF